MREVTRPAAAIHPSVVRRATVRVSWVMVPRAPLTNRIMRAQRIPTSPTPARHWHGYFLG